MAPMDDLLVTDARSEAYLRNLCEMVRPKIDAVYQWVQVVRMRESLFLVAGEGAVAYRFGIPPESETWVAEASHLSDPPGTWIDPQDGPDASASQVDVAEWVASVLTPEPEIEEE